MWVRWVINLFEFARRNDISINIEYVEKYNHFKVIMTKGECHHMEIIRGSDYCRSKYDDDDLLEMILNDSLRKLQSDFDNDELHCKRINDKWYSTFLSRPVMED